MLLERWKRLREAIDKESAHDEWRHELTLTLTMFTYDFKALPVLQWKIWLVEIIEEIVVTRDGQT